MRSPGRADHPVALQGLRVADAPRPACPSEEKDAHHAAPSPRGDIDVLIATTVIEVGVDVPNAHHHGRRSTPTASASPSCTSCAAGSAVAGCPGSACSSPTPRPARSATRTPRRGRRDRSTASRWPGSTSTCGARATCSVPPSRAADRASAEPAGAPRRGDHPGGARGGRGAARGRPGVSPPRRSWPSGCRPRSEDCPLPPTTWKSRRPNDSDHRRRRRRATPTRSQGGADPSHHRPGPRGALLGDRVVLRLAGRTALPRPLRRHRRGRAGGLVPRRRGRDPGRVGPAYGRGDPVQREGARLPTGRRGRGHRGEHPGDASRAAAYDLVFLDPPYPLSDDAVSEDIALLVKHGWLVPGALVVVERSARSPEPVWPDGFTDQKSKKYGETTLWDGTRRTDRLAEAGLTE